MANYDSEIISEGGGVDPRSLKAIRLSVRVAATLGTGATSLTRADLIRTMLRAPTAAFGSYARASTERDADAEIKKAIHLDRTRLPSASGTPTPATPILRTFGDCRFQRLCPTTGKVRTRYC